MCFIVVLCLCSASVVVTGTSAIVFGDCDVVVATSVVVEGRVVVVGVCVEMEEGGC